MQPSMRYKARTDLERIFDVINNYSFGKANRKIIINQLKQLELSGPHSIKSESREEGLVNLYNRALSIKQKEDVAKKEEEENYSVASRYKPRRRLDNSEARNLMSELYVKTHFKAASVYTVLKNSPRYKAVPPKVQTIIPDEVIVKENRDDENKSIPEKSEKEKTAPVSKKLKKSASHISYNESIDENFMKYAYINPYIKNDEPELNNTNNDEQLKYLKRISSFPYLVVEETKKKKNVKFISNVQPTVKRNSLSQQSTSLVDGFDDSKKKDEENIKVMNEFIPKYDINLIANRILRRCNFYHSNNKNNDTTHHINGGKLMNTMGMPVSEFLEKKHLSKHDIETAEKKDYSGVQSKLKQI